MSLDSLLQTAKGLPGYELWEEVAPRAFLLADIVPGIYQTIDVIPAGPNCFAALTSSPLGFMETLPTGWTEISRMEGHFISVLVPDGTTAQQVREELALAHAPHLLPRLNLDQQLASWLENEIYGPVCESSLEYCAEMDWLYS